jgi:hypothetical protein
MADSPLPPRFPGAEPPDELSRREKKWLDIVDEQISEAEKRGDFDNLRGKGKPLDLRGNPHAGDWEMAYTALAGAGYAPDWIERDKEIRGLIDEARAMLDRHVTWHNNAVATLETLPDKQRPQRRLVISNARANVIDRYQQKVAHINTKITNYNLICPVPHMQRFKLRPDDDIRHFEARLMALP